MSDSAKAMLFAFASLAGLAATVDATVYARNLAVSRAEAVAAISVAQKPFTPSTAKFTAESEIECMARAVYHEARGEPILGQHLVADSVMNRVADSRWPNTVCEVVYQNRTSQNGTVVWQYEGMKYAGQPIGEPSRYEAARHIAVAALELPIRVSMFTNFRTDDGDRPGRVCNDDNPRFYNRLVVGNHKFCVEK